MKEARQETERWRAVLPQGKDPIKERDRLRREAAREVRTLDRIALEAFEARKAELKGDGKAGRWFSPLELHVLPKLGSIPIEEIDQQDIRTVLAPLWHTKSATAEKALTRIGVVFDYAAGLGIDVDLQATRKASALLGKSRHSVTHVPAMHWPDVPAFYASLSELTVTHFALQLLILTAGTRSMPIRFRQLGQIDGDVWTVPGDLMKSRRGKAADFRVPLSGAALKVIDFARPHARDGYLFPNVRKGVISDATMARLMERRGTVARPHGFRSSFRTWCDEATDAPYEVKETAIAHVVASAVDRAYIRTDYLDQRRDLMERWAHHVCKGNEAQ